MPTALQYTAVATSCAADSSKSIFLCNHLICFPFQTSENPLQALATSSREIFKTITPPPLSPQPPSTRTPALSPRPKLTLAVSCLLFIAITIVEGLVAFPELHVPHMAASPHPHEVFGLCTTSAKHTTQTRV